MFLSEPTRSILLIWLVVLGGCVGSFLNVVIYRLPRGMSLISPGSHCPSCDHPIRWWHNMPVVSWLLLHGRCHDCGSRIAMRYPAVEAIVAFWFGTLAWYGPLGHDVDLLIPTTWMLYWETASSQWIIYITDLVLLCVLLCLAWIDSDSVFRSDLQYPIQLWGLALVFGCVVPTRSIELISIDSALEWMECLRLELVGIPNFERGTWFFVGTLVFLGVFLPLTLLYVWDFPRNRDAWRGLLPLVLIGAYLGMEAFLAAGMAMCLAGMTARCIRSLVMRSKLEKRRDSHPNPRLRPTGRTHATPAIFLPAHWASLAQLLTVTGCLLIAWRSLLFIPAP